MSREQMNQPIFICASLRQIALETAGKHANDPVGLTVALASLRSSTAWWLGKQGWELAEAQEFCEILAGLVLDEHLAITSARGIKK